MVPAHDDPTTTLKQNKTKGSFENRQTRGRMRLSPAFPGPGPARAAEGQSGSSRLERQASRCVEQQQNQGVWTSRSPESGSGLSQQLLKCPGTRFLTGEPTVSANRTDQVTPAPDWACSPACRGQSVRKQTVANPGPAAPQWSRTGREGSESGWGRSAPSSL